MAKEKVDSNRLGLTIGALAAALHALWAIIVAIGLGAGFLNFIFPLHFLASVYTTIGFNFFNALLLVVLAFVGGYIVGWFVGVLWNAFGKK